MRCTVHPYQRYNIHIVLLPSNLKTHYGQNWMHASHNCDTRVALQIQLPYNLQNGSPRPIVSLDGMSQTMSTFIPMSILEHLLDNFRTCVVPFKSGSWVTLAQIKPSRKNCDDPHRVSQRSGIIGLHTPPTGHHADTVTYIDNHNCKKKQANSDQSRTFCRRVV